MAPGRLPLPRQTAAVIKGHDGTLHQYSAGAGGVTSHEPVASSDGGTSTETERGKGNERGGVCVSVCRRKGLHVLPIDL